MKGKILLALITVLVFGLGSAKAQLPPKVVQVSGVVLISDSLFPAGYVAIYRAKDRRGTYSGRDGYFTLPVMVGDTLFFSCTGLKDSYFVIPADSKDNQLSMVQVADLNGDGRSDLCYLANEGTNRGLCARLQTNDGRLGPEVCFNLRQPRSVTLSNVDQKPGHEIVTI